MTETSASTEITDAKKRYSAGVLKYKQMGYWMPDYVPKCVFRRS
jgi:ribulose-bisphosphate carboxylase large chain